MVELYNKASGAHLATITEAQLQFLVDQLEEESLDDRDYYLNTATLEMFAKQGADPELLALLRRALGDREELDIVWSRTQPVLRQPDSPLPATLIYNSKAGRVKRVSVEELQEALREAGFAPVYKATSQESDLGPALAEAKGLVVVAGGDGTVRAVATRLIGRALPLCILPLGTANNIGRTLGLNSTALELVAGLKQPGKRFFDVGYVRAPWGNDYFLEGFGLGIFANTLTAYEPEKGKSIARAIFTAIDVLADFEANHCQATLDGKDISGNFVLLAALNTPAIGPRLTLAPEADPGDGLLHVLRITEDDRVKLRDYAVRIVNDQLERLPNVKVLRGKRLELVWNGAPVHIDAEIRPETGVPSEEREPARGAKPPGDHTDSTIIVEIMHQALELWLPSDPEGKDFKA